VNFNLPSGILSPEQFAQTTASTDFLRDKFEGVHPEDATTTLANYQHTPVLGGDAHTTPSTMLAGSKRSYDAIDIEDAIGNTALPTAPVFQIPEYATASGNEYFFPPAAGQWNMLEYPLGNHPLPPLRPASADPCDISLTRRR